MAKPRQMIIAVNFHFTRQQRGTTDPRPSERIERFIRRVLRPYVVVDSIDFHRTDVRLPEEMTGLEQLSEVE